MPVTSTASLKKGNQTVLGAYRGAAPAYNALSFYRNFAQLKTLNHGIGPAITFTRASDATFFDAAGVLQTAGNNVPRFDHSSTGSSLGLLIEEARTNLLKRSAELDHADWSKVSTTVTANSISSPDGTTSAETIQDTNAAGDAYIRQGISSPANATAYTASVFLKQGTTATSRVSLDFTGATPINRDATVTWSNNTTNYGTLQSVGNGWYRLTFSETNNSSGNTDLLLTIRASGDATGVETGTVYAWGAQLEAGAFPTSYIPTTTAAATRSADSAVVTPISSFYNQSEGTFITATNKSPLSGSFPTIWHLTNGTNDTGNVIGFYNPSNSTIGYDAPPAFSFAASVSAGLAVSGFAFSAASARMAVNGILEPSTDQSATITTDKAALRLGAKRNGSEPLTGHIRKIAYYPRRLSNALLQQLTT